MGGSAHVHRPVKVIVVTRFNVAFTESHFTTDKNGAPTRTDAWLKRRFELFDQVCLPSLKAQSDQDLEWMVFFSDRTPPVYMERIQRIQEGFPGFRPVFLADGEYMVGRFKKEVAARLDASDTHVITMRIDNDDAFHRDAVRHTRSLFTGQEDEIINYPVGLQCDLEGGVVSVAHLPSNPFLARIEKVVDGKVRTVLDIMHSEAGGLAQLRDVITEPMWVQVIHDSNVMNRLDSPDYLFKVDLKADFGVLQPFAVDRGRTVALILRHGLLTVPRRSAASLLRRVRRTVD